MAVQTQIQTRRGTAATWTSTNPTLAAGEIGFETDTNKFKIGTGSTAWTALAYAANLSPLTTKGDLYTYSTGDARLAVGNNGETLVADSSTSTGLRYQAPVNANPVLNSSFQVWQRGTSISLTASTDAYTADRWRQFTQANQATTVSRQATSDTTNLPFIQYCARIQRNSGQTGTAQMSFIQGLETINSVPYAGKTVTLSFYARVGANYSPTSNAFNAMIYTGTGTDQFPTGYTGGASQGLTTYNLTTTWVRYTLTATIPTTATEFGTYFYWNPTGTAGANDYVEITGVQLEVGSVATPFKTYAGTIQGELAACQRYYYKTYNQADTPGSVTTVGGIDYIVGSDGGGNALQDFRFPVTMRGNPTISAWRYDGTANSWNYARSGAAGTGAFTCDTQGQNGIRFYLPVGANYVVCQVYGHLVASAEL
jgi:hypothetical protein